MKSKAGRVAAFITTLGVSAGLVGVAAQTTGAYFSDSSTGAISGKFGSIEVETSGLDAVFNNMLPGVPQTATASYQNTGLNEQDVWVVFDEDTLHSADQRSGINDLGTYGEVHLKSNGTEIFASRNLNDRATCSPGAGDPPCAALPRAIKLADNVQPGQTGNFAFSFNFSEKLKGADLMGLQRDAMEWTVVATQDGIDPFNANNTVTP